MLNVIVPLDFSHSSFNAARYAANMYKGRADINLILYHFYTQDEDTTIAEEFLASQKEELSLFVENVETELESGNNFIDSLAAYAHVKSAHIIIMGLTGKTPAQHRFAGSNTMKISEKEVCPVLVVPEDAVCSGISKTLITSELKSVEETPCLLTVKRILQHFAPKPSIHILNVNSEHYISITDDIKLERDKMAELLIDFSPEFNFMRLFDFHESVDEFVKDKEIDIIIIAPKYHSFYEKLFKTLHTKKLIYQSRVPVLAVHE
jgi:nucleotide-binding universal stress UspA family protein